MEERIRGLVERFNRKVVEDDRLRGELEGVDRTIAIEAGEERYHLRLHGSHLGEPARGEVANPDIRVSADRATMEGLLAREIPPMKAVATGKLKIKASLEDMLRLRKLF